MNERARLARRIIRDHRKGYVVHAEVQETLTSRFVVRGFWHCPHCTRLSLLVPLRVPRAYREGA